MTSKLHTRQTGLTLIELMISVVLGLLLVTGLITIFTGNNQTYRVTEAHSRLQDNARFALDVLSKNVRTAGFSGCRPIEHMEVLIIANDLLDKEMLPETIIHGNEATGANWSPNISTDLDDVIEGTDVITIQHGISCGASLTESISNTDADISIFAHSCGFKINDTAMIADCTDAHIFKVTDVSSATGIEHAIADTTQNPKVIGNITPHFCTSDASDAAGNCLDDKLYNYDAELFKFAFTSYFIRLGAGGSPSLWKFEHTSNRAFELIEGIEDMQIVYGLDTNNDDTVDSYENAQTVENLSQWDQVVSARISLLAQTLENNLTTSDQIVSYNGAPVTGDGKLRRVFSSTITIRNRVQ
ncbi:MAG: hypothetical protein COA90_09735 [Gammaproteobacteria bacterium]|nr:MAG: hypothetical protein COA90_09735 [Gammaproteobacteria bacterium]